jgi:O-antigen/teichoic acid export membrane protein
MRRSRPAEGARSVRLSIWLGRLRYAVAAADQIGLSLFSFGLNFCLLRILTAQEFGVVTLWMALALLAVAVQGALVALPLSVHVAAAADPAAAQRLEDSLASVNAIIVVLTAIIVAGGTALYEPESIASDAVMVAAITLFVVTSLTREYRRAIAFARNDMLLLLAVDIPFVTVTGIGVAAMLLWPWQGAGLDATFLALALGGAAGQVCSRFAMRRPPGRWFRPGWPATYRTVARETVWSLVAGLATDLQNRSYVYVTTTMIGVTEVGALNAVGVLFRPARILVSAWGRSALPRLAGLAAGQQLQSFDRALLAPLAIGAAASGMVYLALWVAWRPIAQ